MSDRSRSLLEHLTELDRDATPGPWMDDLRTIVRHADSSGRFYLDTADAALIVAMRNSIHDLLAALKAAEKAAADLGELTKPPFTDYTYLVAEVRDALREALEQVER